MIPIPTYLEPVLKWLVDMLAFFAIYLVVVVALNLQYGYTGVPNFGLALSVAGGAYATGALTGRIAMALYGVGQGLDFMHDNSQITALLNERLRNDPVGGILILLVVIVIAMVVAGGLGFVASYPAIRLRAEYLMMVLIAMAEAILIIGVNYYPLVGGTFWVHVPDLFAWMGGLRWTGVTLVILASSILVFLAGQAIVTSPFGRLLRAVRENETTAECIGKDVVGTKIRIMVVGSMIAALAGVFYALHTQVVLAAAYTRTDWTFWPWLMLMVGGRGNNIGSLVGAGAVISARRLIIYFKHDIQPFVPIQVVWLEQIMLGLTLILVMAFRPQGILPEKPTRMRGLNYRQMLERLAGKSAEKTER